MVEKYYVAVRPQTNDLHAVHREGCPFLPDYGKRIYLGVSESGQEALRKSQKHYTHTEGCLFCCKEKEIKNENHSGKEPAFIDNGSVKLQIPLLYHQEMICCLN